MKCPPVCYGCQHNLQPHDFKYRNFLETQYAVFKSVKAGTVKEMNEQLKKNWKIIEKYADDPLSKDVTELQHFNGFLLIKLTMAFYYPCNP